MPRISSPSSRPSVSTLASHCMKWEKVEGPACIFSWHNLGFYSDGSEATRRESTATTGSPQRLVHETRLQEKRIALTYWQTCPCMQSGSGGKTLPTPDDRAGHSGKEAKPLDSSNRRVQGRPRLVASFPASVEPKMHDASAEPLQRT